MLRMNIEIKFRAWDKTHKKMYDDFDSWFIHPETYSIDCGIDIGDTLDETRNINEFEIMRYTGMLDKNGREIYEGDVCEAWFSSPWDNEVPIKIKGIVTFGAPWKGCFCFWDRSADNTQLLYDLSYNEYGNRPLKIIGNIYENPEL